MLITKYDPNWGNSLRNLNQIKKYFGEKGINIFSTYIHTCPEIDIAHVQRKTIFQSNLESSSATEYSALGRNLLDLFHVIYGRDFI